MHGSYSFVNDDKSQLQSTCLSAELSELSTQQKLELRSWGFSESVLNAYKQVMFIAEKARRSKSVNVLTERTTKSQKSKERTGSKISDDLQRV